MLHTTILLLFATLCSSVRSSVRQVELEHAWLFANDTRASPIQRQSSSSTASRQSPRIQQASTSDSATASPPNDDKSGGPHLQATQTECKVADFRAFSADGQQSFIELLTDRHVLGQVCQHKVSVKFTQKVFSEFHRSPPDVSFLLVATNGHEFCGFSYGFIEYEPFNLNTCYSYHTELICSNVKGCGTKLLETSILWAKTRPSRNIGLVHLKAVSTAVGFYKKKGYRACEDACSATCEDDHSPLLGKDNLLFMSKCIKDVASHSEPLEEVCSDIPEFGEVVDISPNLQKIHMESGIEASEKEWHIQGRAFRCCCPLGRNEEDFCRVVEMKTVYCPACASTSTCRRYLGRDYHAWTPEQDRKCSVLVKDLVAIHVPRIRLANVGSVPT